MSLLDAQSLFRSYGSRTVLDGVTMTLDAGDRVGLVGANGSGKSTLARILAGVEEPDQGQVIRRRGIRAGYLPQEPRFEGEPTALQAALGGLTDWTAAKARHDEASAALELGKGNLDSLLQQQGEAAATVERLGGWELSHQAESMLARLGVPRIEQPVSTMSGGERRRVDLARLLISRPDVAILDEPTNHLDVDTIEWLEAHLRDEQTGALLLITHDRYFLDRVVTQTAELAEGVVHIYQGGYESYLIAKAERLAQEARVESNRQNLLRRELDWLRRSPKARTTKQKARIDRAHDVLEQKAPTQHKDVSLLVDTVRSGKQVLVLDELRVEIGGKLLVDGLTLAITPGERVGIVGPNGTGKTTLLRTVLGEHSPTSGTVTLGVNARITYLGQKREGLDESASVLDNVAPGGGRLTVGDRTIDSRSYLERFLFDTEHQRQPVSSLSGGEKARVLLAKLLLQPTNLLVLDEPTNDLDVPTLGALEQMLLDLNGTALVVTHDRWFLDRIATSILAFEGDGRVVRYPGGYSSYRELRRADSAAQTEPARKSDKKADKKADTKTGKKSPSGGLTYGERLELDGLMDRIGEAEQRVVSLEATLSDPSTYDKGADTSQLVADLDVAKAEVETLMARWEELESKKASQPA